jgi:hypothetical protein
LARRGKAAALILAGLAVIALSAVALSRSGDDGRTTPELGDTTTPGAVIGALESTGYELRYRKVPKLEEYEIVSGEARHRGYGIQFVVEIKLSGPYGQHGKRVVPDPQPPVLRYGGPEDFTEVGNILYATAHNSPIQPGTRTEATKRESAMSVQLEVELDELFAERYVPVG